MTIKHLFICFLPVSANFDTKPPVHLESAFVDVVLSQLAVLFFLQTEASVPSTICVITNPHLQSYAYGVLYINFPYIYESISG